MDSRESLSMPVAESAPGQAGAAHGVQLRAGAWAGDRELRAAALAAAINASRLKSEALARRLEQARVDARATIAQIHESRPRREMLSRSVTARLRARLDTMPVIEQAKGIIMAQSHCGPDEAFGLLRRASQRLNVPVRELAGQIVASTARPAAQPRRGGGTAPSASTALHAVPVRKPRLRTVAMPANHRPDRLPTAVPD